MTAWRWVRADLTYAVHDRQLAEHGGLDGVRDNGAGESALARPQNLEAYANADAAALAAAYAYGLAQNHGFAGGNKRTARVVARLFLADNGYRRSLSLLTRLGPWKWPPPGRLKRLPWPNGFGSGLSGKSTYFAQTAGPPIGLFRCVVPEARFPYQDYRPKLAHFSLAPDVLRLHRPVLPE